MGEVHAVFEHVLRVHLQRSAEEPLLRVVVGGAAAVGEGVEDVGCVEERRSALDVVPDPDRVVAFHHRIGRHPPAAVGPLLVRDAHVAAFGVPLPTVEGALDDLVDDVAAVAEMGAEVFAVRLHDGHPAGS